MQYTQQQLADITARSPLKLDPHGYDGDLDLSEVTPAGHRDLVWAALHDIAMLRLSSGEYGYNTQRDALQLAARPWSQIDQNDRRRIISYYESTPAGGDRPLRPLWSVLTSPARSPFRHVEHGEGGLDSVGEGQLRQLLEWAVAARRTPQASDFFDAGPTVGVGSHLTVAGVTYAVRMRGGKPTLIPAEYPKPEAGQTWGVGGDQYLITDSGAAVNLGTAQLLTLEDFTLPGTTRGQTFIRLK